MKNATQGGESPLPAFTGKTARHAVGFVFFAMVFVVLATDASLSILEMGGFHSGHLGTESSTWFLLCYALIIAYSSWKAINLALNARTWAKTHVERFNNADAYIRNATAEKERALKELASARQDIATTRIELNLLRNEVETLRMYPSFFGHDAKKVLEHAAEEVQQQSQQKRIDKHYKLRMERIEDSIIYARTIMLAVPEQGQEMSEAVRLIDNPAHGRRHSFSISKSIESAVQESVLDLEYLSDETTKEEFLASFQHDRGELSIVNSKYINSQIPRTLSRMGDGNFVYFVLKQLLNNAVAYGDKTRGQIAIRVNDTEPAILVNVYNPCDEIGIEPIPLGSSTRGEGHGYGLHMASQVAQGIVGDLSYKPVRAQRKTLSVRAGHNIHFVVDQPKERWRAGPIP